MTKHTFWMKACLAGTAAAGLLLVAPLTSSAGDYSRGHYNNKGSPYNGGSYYPNKGGYYSPYGNRYTPHSRSKTKPLYPFPNRPPYPKPRLRRPDYNLYR